MTFEDETNAKLPAISCFIKLGDKYIKHKNNNNKNKKTCICASSICFLGIVSLFLVHQAIGYLKVKLNNLILEIWSLYDQSCPEWTLFKALEALVLAGGGGSAGRKLSDFLSCHLLPKSNPPIHQLSTPQNPKLELLPNGKQWQCTFEVFCVTVAIHICQGTDSHPHSDGYFAMKRSKEYCGMSF